MLQLILATYLTLALAAMLLLWMSLAAAKRHDLDEGSESQRQYQIAMAISNLKDAQLGGRPEDHAPR